VLGIAKSSQSRFSMGMAGGTLLQESQEARL
jgi:hypothetical protein